MSAIIDNNGNIQLNTPYESVNDLIAYGLSDWRFASNEEIQAFQAQQQSIDNNNNLLAQIADIENKSLRGLRDAFLRQDTTFLSQYDAQITALRAQLVKE